MFSDAAMGETSNVIPFAALRGVGAPACVPDPHAAAGEQRRAVERLRRILAPGSLLYVMRRWHNPANDWLICDFFHIDGALVECVSEDVAIAIDRHDPERETGVKLLRPRGSDPLTVLIDGTLSRLLHGEAGAVRHVVIG